MCPLALRRIEIVAQNAMEVIDSVLYDGVTVVFMYLQAQGLKKVLARTPAAESRHQPLVTPVHHVHCDRSSSICATIQSHFEWSPSRTSLRDLPRKRRPLSERSLWKASGTTPGPAVKEARQGAPSPCQCFSTPSGGTARPRSGPSEAAPPHRA